MRVLCYLCMSCCINTLSPIQDGRHFADDMFTYIFVNERCCILIKFSLKYVSKGLIANNPALVQIMAWRRSGNKPLSEPMMISLLGLNELILEFKLSLMSQEGCVLIKLYRLSFVIMYMIILNVWSKVAIYLCTFTMFCSHKFTRLVDEWPYWI